jgi:REP element-mobilizing transposase RayT
LPDFKRKNIRLQDFEYKTGYAYFVTICTKNRVEHFLNDEIAKLVETSINFRIQKNEISVICYCIMPEHIHMLFSLNENYKYNLSIWISSFKRFINGQVRSKFGIIDFWHLNYYDHIVRTDESLKNIAEYILNNPVRKKIVAHWQSYPYSKLLI